jgi:hypothetical protein
VGALDAVSGTGHALGWALDYDAACAATQVSFTVDAPATERGQPVGTVSASLARMGVNKATHVPGDHGFDFALPARLFDGKPHTLYAYAENPAHASSELLPSPRAFQLWPNDGSVASVDAGAQDGAPEGAQGGPSGSGGCGCQQGEGSGDLVPLSLGALLVGAAGIAHARLLRRRARTHRADPLGRNPRTSAPPDIFA